MSEEIEQGLAESARSKRASGKTPTARELGALRKEERLREETERGMLLRAVPKRMYCQMSGRQVKVLLEQAERYGAPLRGETVDLWAVIRWLHDFLAAHASRLSGAKREGDPLLEGSNSPALERYRDEKAKLARIERLRQEESVFDAAAVRDALTSMGSELARFGADLQRQHGPGPYELFKDRLVSAGREVRRVLGVDVSAAAEAETAKGAKKKAKAKPKAKAKAGAKARGKRARK